MSGHSKWHNIQATKNKADAARGKIFTKIGREIAVAVKIGGADPNSNPSVRAMSSNSSSLGLSAKTDASFPKGMPRRK